MYAIYLNPGTAMPGAPGGYADGEAGADVAEFTDVDAGAGEVEPDDAGVLAGPDVDVDADVVGVVDVVGVMDVVGVVGACAGEEDV